MGRAGAPGPPSGSVRAVPALPAGTARTAGGVPVAFPDSAAGAAQAIAAYQRDFASPAILRAGVLRARIGAVATPDYAATMLAANAPGQQRIAAGPIGVGVRRGLQTLYAAVPIGYRVLSYSPRRAEVLTWGFTLLGNAGSVAPAAYFGLTRSTLDWLGGRWRIAAIRAGLRPDPEAGDAARPARPLPRGRAGPQAP